MLLNSHRGVDVPRPSMPGLINVGGAHIQPAKKLPEEMQGFLDNATHGAVYFSLGSYMKSTDMPPEKLAQLLQAFGRLKQLVLWKYENATLGQLPPNVMISKWLPQNDILAHPNVKVFITHGGMFSTQEGIHWGVPMLFIPLFGDQHRNAIRSVRGGNARLLSYSKLNADQLVEHLEALIYEPQYKRNALEMSQRFRDNAIHPLEEASYWLEYIVKHRGAAHLKSHGAFMPLYQYLMLDVLGCVLLALALVWYLLGKLYRWWIAGVAAAASASSQARQVKKQL
ncbi:maker599 [Drosophila busckii]|uniref:UDP-glucuronosyltransferase n=2 Tax=Drosophila busckii TaxID=30019 RepID=A0A0M4EST3_DROBS|nr:maker597 [Drosophila busckii]ALC40231.1 maker599 [Drosophila busckii]